MILATVARRSPTPSLTATGSGVIWTNVTPRRRLAHLIRVSVDLWRWVRP
jgi:hypothetical protein